MTPCTKHSLETTNFFLQIINQKETNNLDLDLMTLNNLDL